MSQFAYNTVYTCKPQPSHIVYATFCNTAAIQQVCEIPGKILTHY